MSMRQARGIFAIMMLLLVSHVAASSNRRFRGERSEASHEVERRVEMKDIKMNLRDSMNAAVTGGAGAHRMAKIEVSIWQTFQALPKNSFGRLAPRSVRYIAHSYFAKEHGWLIKGLEPHGMQQNMTEFHEASILQDKAPALVEALLEARRSDQGLALNDVVIMIGVLERLIFDESLSLLKASYMLNDMSVTELLDETSLHEVLTSYLLVFEMGMRGSNIDAATHQAIKAKIARSGGSWQTLVEFEQDAVLNYEYQTKDRRNPFAKPAVPFEGAAAIVQDLAETYGKWQNLECKQMKDDLLELDQDGSGHIPLSLFYSRPDTSDYQFTESVDYLREIGALDETAGARPRVRIANYLAGPSNCIASHSYYSVCCLSECEGLMNELEGKIQAPTASPERLLSVVSNLTSDGEHTDVTKRKDLVGKLQSIAVHHGGQVPLHGRLFAQWLHHAFPADCPYPHLVEDAKVLTPRHWMEKKATAGVEDRQKHVDAIASGEDDMEQIVPQWSHEEVLPLAEPPKQGRSVFASVLRIGVQLAMFFLVLRFAFTTVWSATAASRGRGYEKKARGCNPKYALPF